MPVARSTEELERQIMDEMRKAMGEVEVQAKDDMKRGTQYFYAGGTPNIYRRTGALGNTPQTTSVSSSGSSVSFEAYLNQSGGYTSGDNPSMAQVLELANYGTPWTTASGNPANQTVGAAGFWEKSEEWIEQSLNRIMGQHFN